MIARPSSKTFSIAFQPSEYWQNCGGDRIALRKSRRQASENKTIRSAHCRNFRQMERRRKEALARAHTMIPRPSTGDKYAGDKGSPTGPCARWRASVALSGDPSRRERKGGCATSRGCPLAWCGACVMARLARIACPTSPARSFAAVAAVPSRARRKKAGRHELSRDYQAWLRATRLSLQPNQFATGWNRHPRQSVPGACRLTMPV